MKAIRNATKIEMHAMFPPRSWFPVETGSETLEVGIKYSTISF